MAFECPNLMSSESPMGDAHAEYTEETETDMRAELEQVGGLYRHIDLSNFTDVITTITREPRGHPPKPETLNRPPD